ncbi:hypothetical protein BABINDRAFT_164608 [Babjeviella inositovora NRRL Y-12698]|uniref:RNase III domain-containing protein n=1 Tax=Babjeviella inositovora NRRL Y-12698 TaxID=984486 RepID=A0A1E3R0G3_9ASCO|nr:uncharacterized protein BABINDRAFT_164608 [Babjeviella inositovora NRRL Y-12698]ODQ82877.1 hypothetical protein BABINDRAFT_164608 [Babjeviella inositovora NRRL Y-12698]
MLKPHRLTPFITHTRLTSVKPAFYGARYASTVERLRTQRQTLFLHGVEAGLRAAEQTMLSIPRVTDEELLLDAFRHSKRYAFLGDAILECTTLSLLSRGSSQLHRKAMKAMVTNANLTKVGTQLGFCNLKLHETFPSSEPGSIFHPKRIPDLVEAYACALFLDGGSSSVQVIYPFLTAAFPELRPSIFDKTVLEPGSTIHRSSADQRSLNKTLPSSLGPFGASLIKLCVSLQLFQNFPHFGQREYSAIRAQLMSAQKMSQISKQAGCKDTHALKSYVALTWDRGGNIDEIRALTTNWFEKDLFPFYKRHDIMAGLVKC